MFYHSFDQILDKVRENPVKRKVAVAGAIMAGVIMGAKAPVVVTSCGSTEQEKFLSLALASLIV